MYNMKEVDIILAVENHNNIVKMCENSKKRYNTKCKKMDDLLIQYHQLDNMDEKIDFSSQIILHMKTVVMAYDNMMSDKRI